MTTIKPYSQACENNKEPILAVLKKAFAEKKIVLEIGSGTGQHAVHFAPQLPHLQWYTSDRSENHGGINFWINDNPAPNLHRPRLLDVEMREWPITQVDAIFTANTCHIMPWQSVVKMFAGIRQILASDGVFCIYGPFNYNGSYSSESNAQFDSWLKQQAPYQAIRHFEEIEELALEAGMRLVGDHDMPANNRILEWQKV